MPCTTVEVSGRESDEEPKLPPEEPDEGGVNTKLALGVMGLAGVAYATSKNDE